MEDAHGPASQQDKERQGWKAVTACSLFLKGNFKPMLVESAYKAVDITEGKVPNDISGTFLKNGPNQLLEDSDTRRSHWFAGDGMLHAMCLKDGELYYCNRFTKTDKYKLHEKLGYKKAIDNFQDMAEVGVLLVPFRDMLMHLGYLQNPLQRFKNQTANTAMIQFAKRTYALVEVNFPFQVQVQKPKNNGDLDIKSVGFDNFDDQLKHACSAHPKVDKHTNELFVFSYDMVKPLAHYSVFNGKRQIQRSFKIPLLSTRMVHEFLITEKYAIVPDLPLEFDPQGAVQHKRFIFHFNKKAAARYGIFKRDSKDGKDVKWFEVEPHHAFHFGGTWDSVNEKGEDIVTVYGVTWSDFEVGFQYSEHPFSNNFDQKYEKFEFNLTTLAMKRTVLIEGMGLEFTNLNQHYYGHKSRYCYLVSRPKVEELPTNEVEIDNIYFNGFIKFDQMEDKIVKQISFGETHTGGELYYQQRDGSDPSKDEDDGYLMTTVHNWKTDQSQFVMWDAKTLQVVVKANLTTRVPNGFHSTFVQENDY